MAIFRIILQLGGLYHSYRWICCDMLVGYTLKIMETKGMIAALMGIFYPFCDIRRKKYGDRIGLYGILWSF